MKVETKYIYVELHCYNTFSIYFKYILVRKYTIIPYGMLLVRLG